MSNNGLIPPTPVPSPYSSGAYAIPAVGATNTVISGTIPPLATNYNNDGCYFIKKGEAVDGPLISPVQILSADLSKTAEIEVDNANGSIAISPAGNPLTSSPARYGLNLESGVNGIIATVGDPTLVAEPILRLASSVSGSPNFGRVYDTYYNRPFIVGPDITGTYITDSPVAGTLLSTFDSNTFFLNNLGFYRFQLDIYMPPNQQVSFNPASCYSFLISNVDESTTYGAITMTASQIFSNYDATFPATADNWFQFSTQLYLPSGTFKIAGYQAQGPVFLFGPNMDSDDHPDNFKFSVFQIAPIIEP
jgi:hypothetical protein